ncbi:hypothetical protein U9M48_015615 [Paspalum notatum var. saurae]|uniref:Uncharacterized protein n=1 Tax=Paspalum notatum var. saurae TaxID=547442 RepID=A0AAQ3T3Z7_PASNO
MAGSFRDGAGPGDAHAPPPTPTPPLSQYLALDALPSWGWGADPKQQPHWRHPELRRALVAEDHDELRRIRASLHESTAKAKDRARSQHEAIQKLDKYKNIVTRKRQRAATESARPADKLTPSSSSGALRMGAQNNSAVLSKRVRSSLADARVEGRGSLPTRQGPLVSNDKSSPVKKEKSCTRMSATVSGLSEDKLRGLSTGGEGWDKKMKRKRSVGTMISRAIDADRDVKSVGQHRPANEVRPRSSDGLAYRHGASAGALAGNKLDGTSQQNNIASRIPSKTDVDYAAQPNERRERHAGVEKERATVKGNNKLGQPPTKKGSDCKASSWHLQALNNEPTHITGEPEDDQEELLAAVNAARSAIVGAYAGPFWKKMEPMLTFISSENLSFLKNQINIVEELEMSMSYMSDGEHDIIASSDYRRTQKMEEHSSQVLAPSNFSPSSQQSKTNGVGVKGSNGCFSPGDENHTGSQKVEADKCRNPYTATRYLENELQASAITSNFGLSVDFTHSNSTSMVHQSMCNGFTASSNFINSNSENSVHIYPESGPLHDLIPQISRQCQNPGKDFPLSPYEYQYGQMSVEDKILIELQSIGICPETVPKLEDGEDEDINKIISELRKRLHDQENKKKCRLHKLDKSIQDTKDIEERSLEQHAMNKLVERAYRKLKGGRVGSSHKAGVSKSANKAAKQVALAFAKRTLARCHKFDETGKSCFSEPSLWSVLSAPLPSSDAKSAEGVERLKHQKLDRTPFDQGGTKWKKSDRECDHNRDASAKGSGLKSGRHSSGGSRRSGERKNKTKPKQKLAQLSTSGNVLGRVVEPFSSPAVQEPPEPPTERKTQHPTRNTSSNAAQRPTMDAALPVLPGLDDILDVPGGLDGQGNDISSWFTDGLDDSLQDIDLSGALEIPDDDLTQLGFI